MCVRPSRRSWALRLAQADALGGEELVVCPECKAADAALAEIALLARHDVAAAARAFAYDLALCGKLRRGQLRCVTAAQLAHHVLNARHERLRRKLAALDLDELLLPLGREFR